MVIRITMNNVLNYLEQIKSEKILIEQLYHHPIITVIKPISKKQPKMNRHTPVIRICKFEAVFMSDLKSKPGCFLQNSLTDFGIKIYQKDPIIQTMKTIIAKPINKFFLYTINIPFL